MGALPPLQGYNHNIPYNNRIYHVQTEDSGVERPYISTHLFHEGLILASKKFGYENMLSEDGWRRKVSRRMKDQHKRLMKGLIHGEIDGQIIDLLGSLDPHVEVEEAEPVLEAPVDLAQAGPAPELESRELIPAPATEEDPEAVEEPEAIEDPEAVEEPPSGQAEPEEEPEPEAPEEPAPAPEEEEDFEIPDELIATIRDEGEPDLEIPDDLAATLTGDGIPAGLTAPTDQPVLEAPADLTALTMEPAEETPAEEAPVIRAPVLEVPAEFIRPPTAEEIASSQSSELMEEPEEEQWEDAPDEFVPPPTAEEPEILPSLEPAMDDFLSDEVVDDMEPVQLMTMSETPAGTDVPFPVGALAPPDLDSTTLVDPPFPAEPQLADRHQFQRAVTGELNLESGDHPSAEPLADQPSVQVDESLPSLRVAETAELPVEALGDARQASLRSAETAELHVMNEQGELIPDVDEMISRYRSGEYAPRDTRTMDAMEEEGAWPTDDTDPSAPPSAPVGEESMDEPVFEFVFGDDEASAEYRAVSPKQEPAQPSWSEPARPEPARPEPPRPEPRPAPRTPVNPFRPTGGLHKPVAPARPTRTRASVPPVRKEPTREIRPRPKTKPPAMALRPPAPPPEPAPQGQKFKTKPSGVFPLVGGTARRFTPAGTEQAKEAGPLRRRPSSLLRYTAPTRSHAKADVGARDPRITQGMEELPRQASVTGPQQPARRGARITTKPLETGGKGLQRNASSVVVTTPIIVGKKPAKPRTETQPVGSVPVGEESGRYSYFKEQEMAAQRPGQPKPAEEEAEDRGLDEVILAYLEENE